MEQTLKNYINCLRKEYPAGSIAGLAWFSTEQKNNWIRAHAECMKDYQMGEMLGVPDWEIDRIIAETAVEWIDKGASSIVISQYFPCSLASLVDVQRNNAKKQEAAAVVAYEHKIRTLEKLEVCVENLKLAYQCHPLHPDTKCKIEAARAELQVISAEVATW